MKLPLLTKGKKNKTNQLILPGFSRDMAKSESASVGFECEASPYQEKDNANTK